MAKQIEYKSIELKEATTTRQADGRLKVVAYAAIFGNIDSYNDIIVKGLHTLGLEALIITLAAVIGSTLFAWGLWYLLYIRNRGKETKA